MPSFRPRISILTALLLMTIFGMALAIVQLWCELVPLRAEVHQLRNETGRLSIDDKNKIQAIEVRTNEALVWKWRVWIPAGKPVYVQFRWSDVPRVGVPSPNTMSQLQPGERWVIVRAQRDPKNDSWNAVLETEDGSSTMAINEKDCWWLLPSLTTSSNGVGFSAATEKDDGQPFLLKRYRVSNATNNASQLLNDNKPTAGFIIWLERK